LLDKLLGARQPATFLPQVVIAPLDGNHRGTLVYLHACTSSNQRYLQGKEAFASNGIKFVFPLAPSIPIYAHDNKECSSWFDYSGSADGELEVDPLSLEDIRVRLSLTLKREAALLGEDGHKRLVVGGISQGGAAAMHAVLMHPVPVAGILGVCSTLLPCTPPEGCGRSQVHFFGHEIEPATWVRDTVDVLKLHHAVVDHGDIFGWTDQFDPACISNGLEADCLRSACEAILDLEDSGASHRILEGGSDSVGAGASSAHFSVGAQPQQKMLPASGGMLPPGRISSRGQLMDRAMAPKQPALPPPHVWQSSQVPQQDDEVLCIDDDQMEDEDRMLEFGEEAADKAIEEQVIEYGEEQLHVPQPDFQESGSALSLLVNLEKASARSAKRLRTE